jgi:hypothetical protein
MQGWERNLVFEQQVTDFQRVWAGLHPDIVLVCLCGNNDVGNRPTWASIRHWTSSFGDDFLSFWVNGTFNLCLNNCLFSNPTGAPDLFKIDWRMLVRIMPHTSLSTGTFLGFLSTKKVSWIITCAYILCNFLNFALFILFHTFRCTRRRGPPGSSFADSYFTIPYEQRKIAMTLFKKYNVTACFSGHFHQVSNQVHISTMIDC